MTHDIKLYIGGQEVDLSSDIDILFNYSVDELTNPTIVRNSYSKTVTIENTPNNSTLFGQFWNVERQQQGDGEYGISFNPSKRVPFELYVNGEMYQSGYAKLMNVKTTGRNSTYEVSLFGGLGSFFYNLSYMSDEGTDDNKRKLSDLTLITGSTGASESELDFVITKETVKDAWDNLSTGADEKWNTINFAECYDGYPSDYDADKVLMYLGNTPGPTGDTSSMNYRPGRRPAPEASIPKTSATTDASFATYDGYALATMPKERTADEMREYRSYLMRPVLRVKKVIEACCNPENNGGYDVELDNTFFNENNPYWEKAWMTLPLLTTLDFNGSIDDEQPDVTASTGTTITGGTRNGDLYKETTSIELGTITSNTMFNFDMDLNLQAVMNALPSGVVTSDPLYACAYSIQSQVYYPGAIEVQLVAYSQDNRVITASEVQNLTSGYYTQRTGGGRVSGSASTHIPTPNEFPQYHQEGGTGITYTTKTGGFTNVSGNVWQFEQAMHLSLKKVPKTATLKLLVTKVNSSSNNIQYDKAMCLWQRYYDAQNRVCYRTPAMINHFNVVMTNPEVTLMNPDEAIRTGAKFKKADLLNTDYSPADFLLSYCKLFGLYFEKDKYEDKIYIRTRNTFYNHEDVVDLSQLIDRSKEILINPMVFDAKWYNWKLDSEETLFGNQYKATYGNAYGIQRVNTGYNFDSSEKDLYRDNIFKDGIECLEKDELFTYVGDDDKSKPWMFDGFTYELYNVENLDDAIEIEMANRAKNGVLKGYSSNKYYDLFSKLQLHGDDQSAADGGNILVFYNGSVPTRTLDTNTEIKYFLTDDNMYMARLNDNTPCWLYTNTETDGNGNSIAIQLQRIPQFGRYLANRGTGNISRAWDFGTPKQLFIPGYQIEYKDTIYDSYWRRYISDMYDINTKKLTCYCKMDKRPAQDWLRRFYWFDNCIWRINNISEANVIKEDTTKIEFIKVQDIANYSNEVITDEPAFTLTLSTATIGNNGGTVTVYVNIDEDKRWYVSDYVASVLNPSQTSGLGSGSFTITIPANTGNEDIVWNISVEDNFDNWAFATLTQQNVVFTVKEFANYSQGDVPQTGGTALFNVKSTYPWTVTIDRTYAEINPDSGTGSTSPGETVELTFGLNTSYAPRNVKMTFTNTIGNQVVVYKWQEGISIFNVERTDGSGDIAQAGATATLKVTSPDQSWTATTTDSFVTLTNSTGTTTQQMGVTFSENTGSSRTATIVVTNNLGNTVTYTLTQAGTGGGGQGLVSPTLLMFDSTGGTKSLSINIPNEWRIVSKPDWVTVSSDYGLTSTTITVTAPPYSGNQNRQSSMVVADMSTAQGYLVTCLQYAASGELLAVSPSQLRFASTGGTATMTIISNTDWTIA